MVRKQNSTYIRFSINTCKLPTKLTLTIEQDVIKAAKAYARKKGRSVSELVGNYLKTLADKDKPPEALSPRVKRLTGAIKLPSDFDYKKDLEQEIVKEYESTVNAHH